MLWPGTVVEARFLRRYKRFLADFELSDGSSITAHCANTGSMVTCQLAGARCLLTHHPDPKRKLKYSWQAIQMPDGWVGINTALPNHLVQEAIENDCIAEIPAGNPIRREVKISDKSRIDLVVDHPAGPVNVEVKNVTLELAPAVAGFPDAVTARGLKHLDELVHLKQLGQRAVLFFCVQRVSAERVLPADDFDPAYGKSLRSAHQKGVEVIAYRAQIDKLGIRLDCPLPVHLDPPQAS